MCRYPAAVARRPKVYGAAGSRAHCRSGIGPGKFLNPVSNGGRIFRCDIRCVCRAQKGLNLLAQPLFAQNAFPCVKPPQLA